MKALHTILSLSLLPSISSKPPEFYVPIGTSQDSQPTCTGIDSHYTYLCTDTPAAARIALGLTDRGTTIKDRNLNFATVGVRQRLSGSEEEIMKAQEVLMEMIRYIDEEVMSRSEYEHVRESCKNEHELCAFWTSIGECDSNRKFMLQNCAAACRLCLLKGTVMLGG